MCCQKLTCTFLLDVEGLGYLEGGTEANVSAVAWSTQVLTPMKIQQDAKVELPFWLAQTLSLK